LPQFYVEGTKPSNPINAITKGCPDDCGLCNAHSQIAGVLAIEVSNKCNSDCPCCITHNPDTFELSVRDVENAVKAALKNQSSINTATLTGGEPTIHPHFFELLDVLNRPEIDYVSVNTNGIRIANDEDFVKELASRKDVHISLHYDGVHSKQLRGIDHSVQVRAAKRLNEYGIDMVPVILVAKGYNDVELGSIIEIYLQITLLQDLSMFHSWHTPAKMDPVLHLILRRGSPYPKLLNRLRNHHMDK
jgi:uncharacterized radical SAM superfamily Fe-S cluster-containing enzyme